MAELEFTGSYYECDHCDWVWDYNDTHCPQCGQQSFEDVNVNRIKEIRNGYIKEIERLKGMLVSHYDWDSVQDGIKIKGNDQSKVRPGNYGYSLDTR